MFSVVDVEEYRLSLGFEVRESGSRFYSVCLRFVKMVCVLGKVDDKSVVRRCKVIEGNLGSWE